MTTLYRYDRDHILIGSFTHTEGDPIPANTTSVAPTGSQNLWTGMAWIVADATAHSGLRMENDSPVITKYAFRSKFTAAEKIAIETSAETDAAVRVIRDDLNSSQYVDLSLQSLKDGLQILVDKDLLTTTRRDAILNIANVTDSERSYPHYGNNVLGGNLG